MTIDARYLCQTKLPGFDRMSQAKLQKSKALIVGVGGLGCPVAQYLTSAGIGRVDLLDHDKISRANLHRQILFGEQDIGKFKAIVAKKSLSHKNSQITIKAITDKLNNANVLEIIKPYNIILDCTDNYETRYLLNDACVLTDKPLVYGAAYQYEGQVAIWNGPQKDKSFGPHYRDIFPEADTGLSVDCASGGVMPTLTGIIGCIQANETIKYITNSPDVLVGKLLLFDARSLQTQIIELPKKSHIKITKLPRPLPTISAKGLKSLLKSAEFQLIDVRDQDERQVFSIGGQSMPLENILLGQADINPNKSAVFYCRSGKRSATAVRFYMQKYPTAKVRSLDGGVEAWQEVNS